MTELKHKVGDKVLVKDLEWYNKNKNENDEVMISSLGPVFTRSHSKYAGKILMFNNCRDAFAIAEAMLGYSLNTEDPTELRNCAALLTDFFAKLRIELRSRPKWKPKQN